MDIANIEKAPITCTVNPRMGREKEFELKPAEKVKGVLVIGGGPGGMEVDTVAALRGHRVTLWEKNNKLGGLLNWATPPPHKEELNDLIEYLASQIRKAGVKVELGKEATAESITEFQPDVVVVATGSSPFIPQIAGIEHNKVSTALDILSGSKKLDEKVVIIGGGRVGCETAEFLAGNDKQVTIAELREELAADTPRNIRISQLHRLREKGVRVLTGVVPSEITDEGLAIYDWHLDKDIALEADNIVLAAGFVANNQLFSILEGKVAEIYAVGDCLTPGSIRSAIHGGAAIGGKI